MAMSAAALARLDKAAPLGALHEVWVAVALAARLFTSCMASHTACGDPQLPRLDQQVQAAPAPMLHNHTVWVAVVVEVETVQGGSRTALRQWRRRLWGTIMGVGYRTSTTMATLRVMGRLTSYVFNLWLFCSCHPL